MPQRPRSRWKRPLLLAALLFTAAALGRWVAAPWAIHRALVGALEAQLEGRFTISALRLALLSGRIEIVGLSYEDPSGRPVLEVRSGVAHLSLQRWIRGETLLDRLDIDGARLFLALTPRGSNIEDCLRGAAEEESRAALPHALPHLVLRDCEVLMDAPFALRENLRVRLDGEMLASGLEPGRAQVQVALVVAGAGEDPTGLAEPIHLSGDFDTRSTSFKLSTDSRGVQLNDAVRGLLDARLAETGWDWLNPTGAVRVEIEGQLHRVDGLPCYRVSLFNAEGLGLRIRAFPYAVEDVQGVTLILPGQPDRRGCLVLDNLRGTHGRAIATIAGEVYGYLEEGGQPWVHLLLEGRDVPLDRDLKQALEKVDPHFGQIWDAVSPQGTADFQCLLYKTAADRRVRAALTASIRNGAFNYLGFPGGPADPHRKGFPYPLTEVSGSFESQLGYTRFAFKGRGSGRSDIMVVGEVRAPALAATGPALDIRLQGRDVPFDDALRRALLDLNGDRLWKQIQPEGVADLSVNLQQKHAGAAMDFEVELDLKGRAAFVYELVPIRLARVSGRIRFIGGESFPRFERVHGQVAGGEFRLEGTLHRIANECLEIALSDAFLGPPLIRALLLSPHARLQEVGRVLERYGLEGGAEADLVLRGLPDVRCRVDFRFAGGRASGPDLPLELANLSGSVAYDGSRLRLTDVVGWHDRGRLEIRGEQQLEGADAYQKLRIDGEHVDLSAARLPDHGPLAGLAPVFRELRPRGTLRRLHVDLDTRNPDRCPYVTASIGTLDLSPARTWIDRAPLDPGRLAPIRLERGEVFYAPGDGFQLRGGAGTIDRTAFTELDLACRRAGEVSTVELRGAIEHCLFGGPLFGYLGETAERTLESFAAQGTFDLKPVHLELRIPEAAAPSVRIAGPSAVTFHDVSVRLGTALDELTGRLEIAKGGELCGRAASRLESRLAGASFRIFGMKFEDLRGSLLLEGARRGPAEALLLMLRDAEARFYGGRIGPSCCFEVMLGPPHSFTGRLVLDDAEVSRLIDDLAGGAARPTDVTGKLSGQFQFEGDGAGVDALEGVGRAQIVNGRFGSIPAYVTLFNYFNNHFHQIETSHFEVCRRRIYLGSTGHLQPDSPLLKSLPRERPEPKFRLVGSALNLEGSGVVNFGGEMELRFEPRDVWLSTPIPGVRHVLDMLIRQTGRIYVLGTVERVDVQPVLFGIGKPRRGEKQPLRIADRPLWPERRW
ncbi:MAG: hypothetical protein JXQ29_01170 [Planctomycetes bacterium]|nr:hypothetical protein [Planctomycetota bacterium]